jgi:hypothetical protein
LVASLVNFYESFALAPEFGKTSAVVAEEKSDAVLQLDSNGSLTL